ncbi:MAG: hypothetical protein PWP44_1135 [Thermacetogenium sp.]|nr:hypothetical protein [Thermacetogenium sp.]
MDIHHRLATAAQRVEEKRKLLRRLEHTCQMATAEKERSAKLKKRLTSEEKDLKRLDGLSLVNLFHTVLGDKEKARQKERQEYLAAKLSYDESCDTLKTLEAELEKLEKEVKALGDPEREYEAALKDKEGFLLQTGAPAARQLFELDEQEGRLVAAMKEIDEALRAGEKVIEALGNVENHLSSARNWGAWDLLGGGLLATAVKHSRLNEARIDVHRAQQLLHLFERELADVKEEMKIDIGGLATFADFFFDGLIVDLVVQSRIHKSLDCTKQQKARVQEAVARLRQMVDEAQNSLKEIHEQRRQIIENA